MKYEYRKLRGRIIEKYETIDNFSKKLPISSVSVSKKLNGHTEFSQSDIEEWSDLLDINIEEAGIYFFA